MHKATHQGAIISSGILLGTGLGGFFDGILLHQILQWHNMLSSVTPSTDLVRMKYNMMWDGFFHALTWAAVVLGIYLLFRAGTRSNAAWTGRLLGGTMLAG